MLSDMQPIREGEAADRVDFCRDRIPTIRCAVVPLQEFRERGAQPPCRTAAAQTKGCAT